MSSGWSSYAVESDEARERRLLAAARTRRQHLLEALRLLGARQRSLGLPTRDFHATDGDSSHVAAQCTRLEELLRDGEHDIQAVLTERERAAAQEQLTAAMSRITVDPGLVAELARARDTLRDDHPPLTRDQQTTRLATLAAQLVERQDVADPEIATRAAQALQEPPQRSAMLLTALRDEVDRRNARHRATLARAQQERDHGIAEAAQAAARAEETRFVQEAVRDSLRALGYHLPDVVAQGEEQALVVRSAAHPEHAVLARADGENIHLDTVRVQGSPSPELDRAADQSLCDALAAFRDELQKRGVTTTRISHLPAGFAPVTRRELRKRPHRSVATEQQEQHR